MPLTSFFHHPIRGIGANLVFVSVLVSLLCATWFLLAASLSPHIHFNPPPVRFAKPPISNISDSFFSSDLFSPSETTLPNVPPGFTIVDVDGDSSIEFAIAAWLMRTSDTPSIVQITLIFNIALLSAQYNMWSASIRRQKKLLHSVLSVLHASSLLSWALASFQWPRLLDHLAPWMSEIWLSAVLHASALAGVFLYSLVCWSLSLHLLSDQTEIDSLNAQVAQPGVLSWAFLMKVFRAIAALAMQPRVQQLFRSIFLLFTISFLSSAPLSALWPSATSEFFGPELASFNLFISFMAAVALYTLYNLRSAMLAARDEWLALGWSARDMTYARWIASATVWWLLGACMLRGVTIVVNLLLCRETSSTLCSSWFDDWFVPLEWFGQADQMLPLLLRSLLSPSGVYLVDLLFRLLLLSISTSSDFLALDGLRLIDVQRRLAHVTEKLDSAEAAKGVASPSNGGFASPPTSLVGAPTPAAIMDSLRDVHSFVRDFLSDAAGLQTLMPSSNAVDAEERGRQRAFLQSVTLHLRAPVQSVIAMAKMMLQHAIAPPVTNSASGVSNGDVLQIRAALICAQNLLETLDNLISFCEIEDNVAPSPEKPSIPDLISMGPLSNLRESLDEALDTLGIRLSDKSIELLVLWEDPLVCLRWLLFLPLLFDVFTFLFTCSQVLPNRKVHLDHEKYTSILINLLTNAVQHCPTGSDLLVRVSLRPLSPAAIIGDLETCTLAIEIEDFGVGIAPEKIERVFEPFYSVTKRLKQQNSASADSDSDNEGASSPSSRKPATDASDSDATPTVKTRSLPARRGDSNTYFDGFCTSPSLTSGRRPRQKQASLRAPARLGAGLGCVHLGRCSF
jgi:signal transduction histidine kinase